MPLLPQIWVQNGALKGACDNQACTGNTRHGPARDAHARHFMMLQALIMVQRCASCDYGCQQNFAL